MKLRPFFSDHCIVAILFNEQKGKMPKKEITFGDYKKADLNKMFKDME